MREALLLIYRAIMLRLETILEAIHKAGFNAGSDIYLGLDVASTEFYKEK